MYFRLMAAMLYLPVTQTLESIQTSPNVLLDPEIVEVTVGMPLPVSIQDLQSELQVFPVYHPPFWFLVEHGWIFIMAWHCQRQRWLRRSWNSAKQRCIHSHDKRNTFLDSRVTEYVTFRLKNSSTHLRFRCRHSTTGWTTSGISTSFPFTLNSPRNMPKRIKNSVGPVSYSRKT